MSATAGAEEIAQASLDGPLLAKLVRTLRAAPVGPRANFDLPEPLGELLVRLGLKRALTPAVLGGGDLPLTAALGVIEAISVVDGHAGRIACYAPLAAHCAAATGASYPALLDEEHAFGLFPIAPAVMRDGHMFLSGRWEVLCGFTTAPWLTVGVASEAGGQPQTVTLPGDAVSLEFASGPESELTLRRCYIVAQDVEVLPEHLNRAESANAAAGEMACLPFDLVYAAAFAAVSLGAARGALDALNELAAGKMSITGGPLLGEKVYAQAAVGRSEIMLRSARTYFYEQVGAARPAGETLRRALAVAAEASATVAQTAFEIAGTTAIFLNSPIQRAMRDVMTANQLAERAYRPGGWHND